MILGRAPHTLKTCGNACSALGTSAAAIGAHRRSLINVRAPCAAACAAPNDETMKEPEKKNGIERCGMLSGLTLPKANAARCTVHRWQALILLPCAAGAAARRCCNRRLSTPLALQVLPQPTLTHVPPRETPAAVLAAGAVHNAQAPSLPGGRRSVTAALRRNTRGACPADCTASGCPPMEQLTRRAAAPCNAAGGLLRPVEELGPCLLLELLAALAAELGGGLGVEGARPGDVVDLRGLGAAAGARVSASASSNRKRARQGHRQDALGVGLRIGLPGVAAKPLCMCIRQVIKQVQMAS